MGSSTPRGLLHSSKMDSWREKFGTRHDDDARPLPALKRARHPERGGGTGAAGVPPWGTHGPGGLRSPYFFSWHGRSPVSHPMRNVPFPPRRSGEHRKGTIPARPYATRTNGEWGYSTRRLCWATCAQGRCHPKEALYSPTFTVIYLLSINLSLSHSLSLSLQPGRCSSRLGSGL